MTAFTWHDIFLILKSRENYSEQVGNGSGFSGKKAFSKSGTNYKECWTGDIYAVGWDGPIQHCTQLYCTAPAAGFRCGDICKERQHLEMLFLVAELGFLCVHECLLVSLKDANKGITRCLKWQTGSTWTFYTCMGNCLCQCFGFQVIWHIRLHILLVLLCRQKEEDGLIFQ